jgi:Ca2+-binding RTX toxin-like protein
MAQPIVSIVGTTLLEGDTNNKLLFTVSLSQPLTDRLDLKYVTENGKAVSGRDFTGVSNGILTFQPGETVKTIEITISNDDISELDENFLVNVFFPRNTSVNPTNQDVLAATGIGTIVDTLVAATTTTLPSAIENLTLVGVAPINGTGNNSSNILTGNAARNSLDGLSGNDTLIGGAGADTLKGGSGNDTFIIDALDTVTENSNSGTDTVQAGFNYTLGSNLENLTLIGAARVGSGNTLDNLLVGNNLANSLIGGAGNDSLAGGLGIDTLNGGAGNDTYVFDGADAIAELATGGTDTVEVGFNYTLTNLNLENVTLTGTGRINATGNIRNNTLIGNSNSNILTGGAGNDILDGNGGIDRLLGGAGDDTYIVDNRGDAVDFVGEATSGGTDTVQTTFGYALGANVERLVLVGSDDIDGVGNTLANTIIGNDGDNVLDGLIGADALVGGSGNDTYIVENIGDIVTESSSGGTDTVKSSINYNLSRALNVENLTLTGAVAVTGTGNTSNNFILGNNLNNTLVGDFGNDTLDGGIGRDLLRGGVGRDKYIVDNVADDVEEAAPTSTFDDDIDSVEASVSFILTPFVEELTLTGENNINGTGNSSDNKITGNSGNNRLSGGTGEDTLDGGLGTDALIGGAGNDIYTVDNFRDVVTEGLNAGIDLVKSSVTFFLGANQENLELTGSGDLNGTGNGLSNTIIGNGGFNILDGGIGNDSLDGGGDNDLIIGGLGNDELDGSTGGIDTLIGGLGNDIYLVGLPEDVIIEEVGQGIETVFSTATTYTISDNVENLILAGGDINGTGNALNNRITGSSGDNVIDGGLGNDIMIGGTGYDTYIVNSLGDRVIENAPSSVLEIDTVFSSINYTLTANVENLTLTGIAPLVGTGNALNNILVGNSGNNRLNGLTGNDTLNGGVGRDTLVGSFGNDTYIIDNIGDIATEAVGAGIDTAQSSVSYTLASNVDNLVLLGTADLTGTGNTLDNVITGNSGNNTLRGGTGDDFLIGGAGNDVLVGQVSNDTLTGGLGNDRFDYNTGNPYSGADLGSDRIEDFTRGQDKIVLGKRTFALTSAVGNGFSISSEFSSFTSDASAKGSSARIVYSSETGNIFYNANGAAIGGEAVITTLGDRLPSLSTSDFIIA